LKGQTHRKTGGKNEKERLRLSSPGQGRCVIRARNPEKVLRDVPGVKGQKVH